MTQISQATITPDASIAHNNGKGSAPTPVLHARNFLEKQRNSGEPCPCIDVPSDNGLLISLGADGTCSMTFEPDFNWEDIHPNVYAPKNLTSVKVLQGGGSGVTVFQGTSPSLGSLVMKHGRATDSREVFSLALISRELVVRGALHPEAASNMRSRIPEFKMVYISPHHLRNRGTELWIKLKANVRRDYALERLSSEDLHIMEQREHSKNMKQIRVRHCHDDSETGFNCYHSKVDVTARFDDVTEKGAVIQTVRGFPILIELMRQIIDEQEHSLWKFTIAQKTIGHPEAKNGALVHTQGLLTGEMLATVIDQFIQVIQNLVVLTRDDEIAGVAEVRKEVVSLQQQSNPCCSSVSELANIFCGRAIAKNFDPKNGRLAQLGSYGVQFRNLEFDCLEESEHRPAHHLGLLLQKGATMDHIFDTAASSLSAFEIVQDSWLDLLAGAASLRPNTATDLIWTNGLTDAGLHNTFVCHQFLWLFDLGEPDQMPIPAFLTKFLMSFMHVFGMEDDDDGGWVCRFVETDNGKLALTSETAAAVPKMHEAFEYALNRFVREVFHGDEEVRKVLLNYVVLQIVSDAAFCLGRWESKGGGEKKYYQCSRGQNLHKWLWRCLWDLYIATDVLNRWKYIMQD